MAPAGSNGRRFFDTASIEFERIHVVPADHPAELDGLVGFDRIVVHHAERIAGLLHMQPRQRPPGATDGIEGAPLAALQHLRIGERLGGDLLGFRPVPAAGAFERQAAERERLA